MYEGPAEQRFIDTYAPLPFQEIMQVGQAFQRERERTEEEMKEFRSEFGDFMSPSGVDTASMDQATFGAIRPFVDKMRTDPEFLRSQEGQAQIRGAMQTVDRSKISLLRQGAENARERQKMISKLQAEGKYNPDWDPYGPVSEWDTLKQGPIPVDVIEYKPLEEMANEYTSNVKPGYIAPISPYEYWFGIDDKAIRNSLVAQFDSVTKTPQGRLHLNDIAKELGAQGITDPEIIKQEMIERMVQSQKDRMVKDKRADEAALKLLDLDVKRTKAEQAAGGGIPRLSDMTIMTGISHIKGLENRMLQNPVIAAEADEFNKEYKAAQSSGNRKRIDEVEAQYNAWRSDNFRSVNRNAFLFGAGKENMYDVKNYGDIIDGSNKVLETYAYTPAPYAADSWMESMSRHSGFGTTKKEDGTFILSNTKRFLTSAGLATRMDGVNVKLPKNGLDDLLREGIIKYAQISPKDEIVTQIGPNGKPMQFLKVQAVFTEDQIDDSAARILGRKGRRGGIRGFEGQTIPMGIGLEHTGKEELQRLIKEAGGTVEMTGAEITYTDSQTQREVLQKEGKLLKSKTEGTTVRGKNRLTYTIDGYVPLPSESNPGDELAVMEANNIWNQKTQTPKVAGAQLPEDIGVTFDSTLRAQQAATENLNYWINKATGRK